MKKGQKNQNLEHLSLVNAQRITRYVNPDTHRLKLNPNDLVQQNQNSQPDQKQTVDKEQVNQQSQVDTEQLHPVDRILKRKMKDGKAYYKIKWVGHKDRTWEPAENIPEGLKTEFHMKYTNFGKRKRKSCFRS